MTAYLDAIVGAFILMLIALGFYHLEISEGFQPFEISASFAVVIVAYCIARKLIGRRK